MTENSTTFTAARIAAVLGKKRQSIYWALRDVPADSQVMVNGSAVAAWRLEALPAAMREQLSQAAKRLGYASAEAMLNSPPKRWEPPIALGEIDQRCINNAVKLQRALAPALARMNDLSLSGAEFEERGVEDYARVFGHKITTRYFRELFKRTVERDGGAEQWERLEIYLEERPAHKVQALPSVSARVEEKFEALLSVIAGFKNPAQPSEEEEAYLWCRVFEEYEAELQAGSQAQKCKMELRKFLLAKAPSLAASDGALKKAFQRKYQRWVGGDRKPSAVQDLRAKNSGNFRAPEVSQEDRDLLIAKAVFRCGGRVSQAWRECRDGELSQELNGYYLENPSSKSYVPKRIREEVKREAAALEDIHHGPRQHQLNGAHLFRDWSKVAAGDWYQADDFTMPIYYYVPDGEGWFTLMRGQILLMMDLRSNYVLGYALQSERSYNARTIRTLITKIADEYGLPRKGFYFERGIWKSSKILKGDPKADPMSWGETEKGLREFGLRFAHARLPRGKPVERVGGLIQNYMEGDPGYAGRDERNDKFERFQRLKLDIERKKVDPREHLYSEEQWIARFAEMCERFNNEEQNGKMTGRHTPAEAFALYQNKLDPPVKFDASCRYLLAHHKRPVRVTGNGITLRFGKQVFNYKNAMTGRLVGEQLLAWFNPETPDILAVTDMNRENPFCVERAQAVHAMEASKEELEREMSRIEEHQSYAKARYRILKAKFVQPFRSNMVDAATVELGRQIEGQKADLQGKHKADANRLAKASKVYRELEMPVNAAALRRPETIAAAERLKEMLQEDEEGQ